MQKEIKITDKQFIEVLSDLLKNQEVKKIYDKSFKRSECQLKK